MLTMHSQTWFSRHVVPGLKMKKIYICIKHSTYLECKFVMYSASALVMRLQLKDDF